MSRQPANKGYQSFPPEYMTVLERSADLRPGESFVVDFPVIEDALNVRRSFYRFRNALNDEAGRDEYASAQAVIANRLIAKVEPYLGGVKLKFTLAPLVRAIREMEARESKGEL